MRVTITVVSLVLAVVGIGLTIRFAKDVQKHEQSLNQERYTRMVAEESLASSNSKVNAMETELARLQNKIKNTEKMLGETSLVNDDLKARLDKAKQIKESMDLKIKELQNMVIPESAPVPVEPAAAPAAQ